MALHVRLRGVACAVAVVATGEIKSRRRYGTACGGACGSLTAIFVDIGRDNRYNIGCDKVLRWWWRCKKYCDGSV